MENSHLENLIKKAVTDFNNIVGTETDVSNMLLKGHLYIENLLDEVLAIFDQRVENRTFSFKIKTLERVKDKCSLSIQKKDLEDLIPSLYALNSVRNNLAHNLNFSPDETSVNRIGITLGSKYIIEKYENGQDKIKQNLLFCFSEIVNLLAKTIYLEIGHLNNRNRNSETKK
ncbi:MAG: hypothetical protein WAW13_00975 [Minisyncoccia bacterium]